ncbi:ArsR/SmtB family transcription factor [Geofilum sp. OHC36d9]|uniref:ArsR/SmtB family transcription factor n=1 Tax=Geofilum sp. OHC36d9 TaxID=3458413 RepID=UPI00403369E4
MYDYLKIIKALADITRLKIIWLLTNIDEKICVSEIVEVLEEHQYNVSRHLKILKDASLIQEVKEGKWVFYYLVPVNNQFHHFIQKAISSIPETEMTIEMVRCKNLLQIREKEGGIQ